MTRRADRRFTLPLAAAVAGVAAAALVGPRPADAQATNRPAAEAPAERALPAPGPLLATEFARLTRAVTGTVAPTPLGLRSAVILAELAAEAAPEDPANWRLLLFAARLAEDREAATRAIEALGRLSPEDDVVTLARLQQAIEDRGRTVEERAEFLRFLVDAGRDGRLVGPVAARIAYELALLRQRTGDVDGFAESLLTALELDPSFVAAARTTYDFFSASAGSSVDEAELLVNLVLADPTDAVAIMSLARVLLEEGAYEGSARMYGIAVDVIEGGSALREEIAESIVADEALALWGAGDVSGAIRVIEDRERLKQDRLVTERDRRRRMEEAEPGSTLELPPLPERLSLKVNLALMRLAIIQTEGPSITMDNPEVRSVVQRLQRLGDAEAALEASEAEAEAGDEVEAGVETGGETGADDDVVAVPARARVSPAEAHAALLARLRNEVDAAYRAMIEITDADESAGMIAAGVRLDHAWAAVALLEDPETARQRLDEANERSPLGLADEAIARFEGWIRLRQGEPAAAIEALRPVAETDPLARMGIAMAHEQLGEAAAARVEYRGVAVAARGTITGVIAERRLRTVYGETMQPTATAARLEGLVSTVPLALDRLAWNQSGGLRIRASFRERRLGPFEPVILDLTLVNNAPVPLTLDPRGPIVPTVMVVPSMVVSTELVRPPTIVVDIQRRLRLAPREELTVSVDLRRTRLGELLLGVTQIGANVRVEVFINHEVNVLPGYDTPVFYPKAISADGESGFLRINGFPMVRRLEDGSVRRSEEVAAMLAAVGRMRADAPPPLDTLGAVNRLALQKPNEQMPPVMLGIRQDAAEAMAAAFPRLDPFVQAWLVATAPIGASLPQYGTIVARSDDPHLLAAWLINMAGRVDDPVLLKALASEDARLRSLGEAVDERLRQARPGR